MTFVGIVVASYGSSGSISCMCIEGAACDCADYAMEATKITGIIIAVAGAGLLLLGIRRRQSPWKRQTAD